MITGLVRAAIQHPIPDVNPATEDVDPTVTVHLPYVTPQVTPQAKPKLCSVPAPHKLEGRAVGQVVKNQSGLLVAVTGDVNKGKTTFIDRISNLGTGGSLTLPAGCQVSTPGLAFKSATLGGRHVVFCDSQGKNAAIDKSDAESFDAAGNEELFQSDIQAELCKNLVVVVNKITRKEQQHLGQISFNSSRSQVFVIHNLIHVSTEDEFQTALDQIKSLYNVANNVEAGGNLVSSQKGTVISYDGHEGTIVHCDGTMVDVEWTEPTMYCWTSEGAAKTSGVSVGEELCKADFQKYAVDPDDHYDQDLFEMKLRCPSFEITRWNSLVHNKKIIQVSDHCTSREFSLKWNEMDSMSIPLMTGFDDSSGNSPGSRLRVRQRHFLLVNDSTTKWGTEFNDNSLKLILSEILAAGEETTTAGLPPGHYNLLTEMKRSINLVAKNYFKVLDSDDAVEVQCEAFPLAPLPNVDWSHLDDGESGSGRARLAETCYKLNSNPVGDGLYNAVLKAWKRGEDFRSLNGGGFCYMFSNDSLISPPEHGQLVVRMWIEQCCVFHRAGGAGHAPDPLEKTLQQSMSGAVDFDDCSLVAIDRRCCEYRAYETLDARQCRMIRYVVDASGMQPTDQSDVDLGLVQTDRGHQPCLVLNSRQITRSEESNEWTKVRDLDFHKPLMQDDGSYAFPLSFLADPASIQVAQENGRLTITVTERGRKR